jgi:5-formyltetrahydrofolate cyclo-ligase
MDALTPAEDRTAQEPAAPAQDPTAQKQELRRSLRTARRETYGSDPERRAREAGLLLAHAEPLLALVDGVVARRRDEGGPAPRVAAFHPTPTEADVMPLAAELAARGAELVFPAAAGTELEWIRWDGRSAFVDSPGRGFGKEPEGERLGADALSQAVLVLSPALAVDRAGTRIGHGAGYYDRALVTVPRSARIVAVVHPGELLSAGTLPREEHDVPIPEVLTADGIVSLVTNDPA